MYCRYCGKEIAEGSKFCPYCGANQNAFSQVTSATPLIGPATLTQPYYTPLLISKEKDEGVTAVIAFVGGIFGFFGLGHLYVGHIKKGFIFLILSLVIRYFSASLLMRLTTGSSTIPMHVTSFSLIGFPVFLFTPIYWIPFFFFMVMAIVVPMFFLQVVDAFKTAKKYNEYIRAYGISPW